MKTKISPLIIGDLEIKIPIILGGMGVQISTAPLVSAVANCGAAGTIASVGLGSTANGSTANFLEDSKKGLELQIQKTRELTDGVIGVNILVALSNYEDLVKTAVKNNVDYIASGAGLPLKLPEYVSNSTTKLIPIVSSARAADIIVKSWKKRYDRFPDAFIVEGPLAGGHLGFNINELTGEKKILLEDLVVDVINVVKDYEINFNIKIPVIAAGGIFDAKDIAKFINLGASGVQMATRFVATLECDVPDSLKQMYVDSKEEDIVIINSPVGLPGRVLKTALIDKNKLDTKSKIKCSYKCLRTCDIKTAPYCIADALLNTVKGNFDKSIVFCGHNVYRVKDIVSVRSLIDELINF